MEPSHEEFMGMAIKQAENAGQNGEVPIGAVIVAQSDGILAADRNRTLAMTDPSAHAEMLALRKAAAKLGNYRLPGTTLYVTVEPCIMCMGAVIHARVAQVVFGAADPKWGAAGSLYDFSGDTPAEPPGGGHRRYLRGGVPTADAGFFSPKKDLTK